MKLSQIENYVLLLFGKKKHQTIPYITERDYTILDKLQIIVLNDRLLL